MANADWDAFHIAVNAMKQQKDPGGSPKVHKNVLLLTVLRHIDETGDRMAPLVTFTRALKADIQAFSPMGRAAGSLVSPVWSLTNADGLCDLRTSGTPENRPGKNHPYLQELLAKNASFGLAPSSYATVTSQSNGPKRAALIVVQQNPTLVENAGTVLGHFGFLDLSSPIPWTPARE